MSPSPARANFGSEVRSLLSSEFEPLATQFGENGHIKGEESQRVDCGGYFLNTSDFKCVLRRFFLCIFSGCLLLQSLEFLRSQHIRRSRPLLRIYDHEVAEEVG